MNLSDLKMDFPDCSLAETEDSPVVDFINTIATAFRCGYSYLFDVNR